MLSRLKDSRDVDVAASDWFSVALTVHPLTSRLSPCHGEGCVRPHVRIVPAVDSFTFDADELPLFLFVGEPDPAPAVGPVVAEDADQRLGLGLGLGNGEVTAFPPTRGLGAGKVHLGLVQLEEALLVDEDVPVGQRLGQTAFAEERARSQAVEVVHEAVPLQEDAVFVAARVVGFPRSPVQERSQLPCRRKYRHIVRIAG